MSGRRLRRWLWLTAIGGLLVTLVGLVIGWLLFQHIPGWYRPVEVPPERFAEYRNSFVNSMDRPGKELHESEQPFQHRFTQDEINAWLAYPEQIWPTAHRWWPPYLSDPLVVIDPQGILLAVTLHEHDVRTVLNARLTAEIVPEGVRIRLVSVAGGSLPIPKTWIRSLLRQIDTTAWPVGKQAKNQIGGPPLPPLAGLCEGITLPASWFWFNGRAPFRITSLTFEQGVAHVTFQPLPRNTDR